MSKVDKNLLQTVKREPPHPHNKPYNKICLKSNCDKPVLFQRGVYYSLCDSCLKQESLGPYSRNYSSI